MRREESIAAFIEAFQSLGYQTCVDGTLESGFIKIAIFADDSGKPTHAARQLPNGCWTSKLGGDKDIEHSAVEDVIGPLYGTPVQFMRRPCGTVSIE